MTNKQKAIIHIAKQNLGLDDAEYRLVLRNIGKVGGEKPSCLALTHRGFEDVMAFFESCGAGVSTKEYWAQRTENRGQYADPRQVFAIAKLSAQQQYSLEALCRKFSDNRATHPDRLTPGQAHKLIEMLKNVVNRKADQ